jgi:coenzyme F420-reducing hydrogenase beta subunit
MRPKQVTVVSRRQIGFDRAVKQLLFIVVTPQQIVQDSKVAQDLEVSGFEFGHVLEVLQTFIPLSCEAIGVTSQRIDIQIVRQIATSNLQMLTRVRVIAVAVVGNFSLKQDVLRRGRAQCR